MNPLLRSSAAHVFVESVEAPALSPDDEHHLFRVLRVRDGEAITVCDGAGSWRPCVVAGRAVVPTAPSVVEPAGRSTTIVSAIPKGDRLEWMVQKLTEIGVSRLVLADFARSVVKWPLERQVKQHERLVRIAREAASQSRRVRLLAIEGPVPFATVERSAGAVMCDPAGQTAWSAADASAVVIGPEGGFTDDELAAGFPLVSLGDTVLRVETAAMVAAARILK